MEFDPTSFFHQSIFNQFSLTKLVRDGQVGLIVFKDIFYRPGMPPGQKLIEILDSFVKLVVFFRSHDNDGVRVITLELIGDPEALFRSDSLGIPDAERIQGIFISVGSEKSGDYERAEEIPFTRFVDPDHPPGSRVFGAPNHSLVGSLQIVTGPGIHLDPVPLLDKGRHLDLQAARQGSRFGDIRNSVPPGGRLGLDHFQDN